MGMMEASPPGKWCEGNKTKKKLCPQKSVHIITVTMETLRAKRTKNVYVMCVCVYMACDCRRTERRRQGESSTSPSDQCDRTRSSDHLLSPDTAAPSGTYTHTHPQRTSQASSRMLHPPHCKHTHTPLHTNMCNETEINYANQGEVGVS